MYEQLFSIISPVLLLAAIGYGWRRFGMPFDTTMVSMRGDLELTDALTTWLAEKGYDAQLGARPLRRTIQRELEDPLSEAILQGEFSNGQLIVADVSDDGDAVAFRAVDAVPAPDDIVDVDVGDLDVEEPSEAS